MTYSIKQGCLDDLLEIELAIPEFHTPKSKALIQSRLEDKTFLLLVTYYNKIPVGYKLGYATSSTEFYSWLGAVHPLHRGKQLAQKMLDAQETWLIQNNFTTVTVKTMNPFRAMLAMLIKNHYNIIDIETSKDPAQTKILFEKRLNLASSKPVN